MSTAHAPASSTLGADILLARHGKRIVAWRVDHAGERTRAKLSDGTWDSAPNSILTPGVSPARKAAGAAAATLHELTADTGALNRGDRRFLGKVFVWWGVASVVLTIGMMALLGNGALDPALLEEMVSGV
ncbi:hypothetical protein DWB68_01445 [Galactobacter valiniphilus]|uniref:Uncharacterized protein n=1 Tax=Galactobacter valiniphilus TaxID=2676122 RepID=A0A399JHD1_9MICC|nr:hypothetical protein [Galactobacter valiniphilus]RII43592.1 hypothetical protein DWB68_01445 [Galactobacter valiniphilus]